MPSTSIKIAWAVPVPIVELGAHLEAYIKLLPTITALRLANRFGKGKKAAITKLPVELIELIEGYLLEKQRAYNRARWGQGLRCWEERCNPMMHVDDDTKLEFYNWHRKNWNRKSKNRGAWEDQTELTPEARAYCLKHGGDEVFMREDSDECEWKDHHEEVVDDWFSRVGHPAKASQGRFEKYQALLRKDFGLSAWTGHVTESDVFNESLATGTTLAFLYMPENDWNISHEWDPDDGYPVGMENACGVILQIPPTPSDKSLARFARAARVLGLPDGSMVPGEPLKEEAVQRPALRLLTVTKDDTDD